jgi:two-component system, sensor histidine kinase and response regulator
MSSDCRDKETPKLTATSSPTNTVNKRILLVEDDKSCQKLAQCILTKAGFIVELADNGRKAVETLRQDSFDLVLMDMQMPQMDGLAATREIRNLGLKDLPILGLTANAFASDRQRCIDAGMNDWITKPVSPKSMLEKVNEWLVPRPVAAASS